MKNQTNEFNTEIKDSNALKIFITFKIITGINK